MPAQRRHRFQLVPSRAEFGVVQSGCKYTLSLTLVNVGALESDYSILPFDLKTMRGNSVRVVTYPKTIGPGNSTTITLELVTVEPIDLDTVLKINTEEEMYHVSVTARVLSGDAYSVYCDEMAAALISPLEIGVELKVNMSAPKRRHSLSRPSRRLMKRASLFPMSPTMKSAAIPDLHWFLANCLGQNNDLDENAAAKLYPGTNDLDVLPELKNSYWDGKASQLRIRGNPFHYEIDPKLTLEELVERDKRREQQRQENDRKTARSRATSCSSLASGATRHDTATEVIHELDEDDEEGEWGEGEDEVWADSASSPTRGGRASTQ